MTPMFLPPRGHRAEKKRKAPTDSSRIVVPAVCAAAWLVGVVRAPRSSVKGGRVKSTPREVLTRARNVESSISRGDRSAPVCVRNRAR